MGCLEWMPLPPLNTTPPSRAAAALSRCVALVARRHMRPTGSSKGLSRVCFHSLSLSQLRVLARRCRAPLSSPHPQPAPRSPRGSAARRSAAVFVRRAAPGCDGSLQQLEEPTCWQQPGSPLGVRKSICRCCWSQNLIIAHRFGPDQEARVSLSAMLDWYCGCRLLGSRGAAHIKAQQVLRDR